MLRKLLDQLESTLLSSPELLAPLSWAQAETLARGLPPKTNLVVPKSSLRDPPPFHRSLRGRPRGALRQFRCSRAHGNLHVKEFERHWVLHVDRWNPHVHPLRHILVDYGYKHFLHVAQVLGDALRQTLPDPAPAPAPAAEPAA